MARDRTHRHGPGRALDVYVATGTLAAAVVAVTAVASSGAPGRAGFWLATAAGLTVLETIDALPFRGRRFAVTFDLAEAAVVFGAATLVPDDARTAIAAGAVGFAAFRFGCPHKVAYAWFSPVLAGTAAVAVAGGPLDMGEPASALRLAGAGVAFGVTSHALSAGAYLIGYRVQPGEIVAALPMAAFHSAVATTLGVLAAGLSTSPWLLPLLVVPVAAVVAIGYAADHSRMETRRREVVLDAARAATGAEAVDAIVDELVRAAAELTGTPALVAGEAAPPPATSVALPPVFAPLTHLVVEPSHQEPLRGEPAATRHLETLVAIAAAAVDNLKLRARLHEQATTDELTGLGNRRQFEARLETAARRARRGDPFGVLFVDLDGFKAVNDRFGHDTGDDLLRHVATSLRGALREVDEVFRLAGDEFTVIVNGVFDDDGLAAVADTARRAVNGRVEVGGRSIEVRASVGGAVWDRGIGTAAAVVRAADARMYASKPAGGSRRPG